MQYYKQSYTTSTNTLKRAFLAFKLYLMIADQLYYCLL